MRKFIVFDTDQSMASIGGPERQREIFGFPARSIPSGGIDLLKRYLMHITEVESRLVEDPLADLFGHTDGQAIAEKVLTLSSKVKSLGVTGIILDTISTLGYQTRLAIMKEAKQETMSLQLWGLYGDRMMRFVNTLAGADFPVVVTCHVDRDRDDLGGPLDIPAVKGSSKLEIPRFFDVVAYTVVNRDNKGNVSYNWQVRPDGRHIFAKDRLGVTQSVMVEQNLKPILDGYEEAGIAPKILIIGDSGQGKTYSLQTIN